MTRTIKASEVKPGMTIQWEEDGAKIQIPVHDVDAGGEMVGLVPPTITPWRVSANTPVTVLSDPAPVQPEEPKAFGAAVETPHWSDRDGCQKFIWGGYGWAAECGNTYTWDTLTEFGTVKVANPDPFAKPAPEVPERIEEWPEDDTALRPYKWWDSGGDTWTWLTAAAEWECYTAMGNYVESRGRPYCGPWERVTDG